MLSQPSTQRGKEREKNTGKRIKNSNHLHTISGYAKKINGNASKTKTDSYTHTHMYTKSVYEIQVIIAVQLLSNHIRSKERKKAKPTQQQNEAPNLYTFIHGVGK